MEIIRRMFGIAIICVSAALLAQTKMRAKTVTPAPAMAGPAFSLQFLGMHVLHPRTDWPNVPAGSMRPSGITWGAIEPSRGIYNWYGVDEWTTAARAHDVQLDYVFRNTPGWACQPASTCVPSMADWVEFITTFVTREKGKFSSYELWNEPNSYNMWSGTPAQLAAMAKVAYPIIKRIDPAALVVAPSVVFGAWPMDYDKWLDQYLQAGGSKHADVIAFHGYSGDTRKPVQPVATITTQVATLRSVMVKNGVGNLPLWDTEGGWGKNTQLPDPQAQAGYLPSWYMLQFGLGVQRVYWYQWDNPLWGTLSTASGGITPAGKELATVYGWLNGVTASSPCTRQGAVWTCPLAKGTKQYQVVWSTAGSSTYHGAAIGRQPALIATH